MTEPARPMTRAEIEQQSEFVPLWDVLRDVDGAPIMIDFDCQYGYQPRPLTEDELAAVRRAARIWRMVCEFEDSDQSLGAFNPDGRLVSWLAPNVTKSRLLGRMIHDGMPPTRSRPPVLHAEPRWDLLPGGDPFLTCGPAGD